MRRKIQVNRDPDEEDVEKIRVINRAPTNKEVKEAMSQQPQLWTGSIEQAKEFIKESTKERNQGKRVPKRKTQ